MAFALGQDGRSQAGSKIVRQFVEFRISVDLNCHLRCVADDVAVAAPGKVLFELCASGGINDAVEVIGQLFQKLRAGHFVISPSRLDWPFPSLPCCLCRKNLVNRFRNCKRAPSRRDFTAGLLKFSASAVSSVESPSTSRNTKTVRKPAG